MNCLSRSSLFTLGFTS
uniref:Uncharacterized protein n=1 Tax=Arundo donax TaxID=35708 RepID=A0A0A9A1V1_ARUDO